MKKIYVSIPCLHDSEIFETISDIYNNSDFPERINVSVAFFFKSLDKEYLNEIKKQLPKNLMYDFYLHDDFMGVGHGRLLSYKNYSGEDYFLQIDSHTMLNKSWDSRLISYIEDAQKIYGDRAVLTGYLPGYKYHENKKVYISRNAPMYPFFISDWSQLQSGVFSNEWKLNHKNMAHSITMENYFLGTQKRYELCNKFNANFIFSKKNFANDYEKFFPFEFLFFEEELIMSIEMFDCGYVPVYPNFDIGLAHLYLQNSDIGTTRNALAPSKEDIEKSEKNIAEYLDNNKDKVVSFYRYANIDEETNLCIKSESIPTKLRNQ